jgi:leader peptidase (prepilin peptidase)/N-methyltransferase
MALVTLLLILALIDLDVQMLPDVITLPGTVLGLAASFLPGARLSPPASAASALAGFGLLWGANEIYRRARGVDGFGGGDPKMAAMIGAFLGWQGTLLAVFIASLAGSLVGLALIVFEGRGFQHKLPLGTFLSFGAILTLVTGDPLLAWYSGFFRG